MLLSISGNNLAKIILSRLQCISEEVLRESQCGFHSNRSTVDMIFAIRQLQEKAIEHNMPLFVDTTKALDSALCMPEEHFQKALSLQ